MTTQPIVDRTYRLLDQLGEGGMGAVFRAVHLLNRQTLALKLLTSNAQASLAAETDADHLADLDLRLALAREFQTLASLHHPNVIRVQSYGFDEGHGSYFTMELLENSLSILRAAESASTEGKVLLIAQLLRALSYIHRRGVLHRDIKPGNVLVVRGEVKLLDFGIAAEKTESTQLAGTLQYMAPELMEGASPSTASDLYAVGLILHQVLTGHLPLADHAALETTGVQEAARSLDSFTMEEPSAAHPKDEASLTAFSLTSAFGKLDSDLSIGASPTELRIEIEGPLGDVVRKLLRYRSEERYQDADDVLRDLGLAIGMEIPVETAETRESFLRATLLIGRDDELAELRRRLDETQQHRGGAALVGGESGVGKSRLLSELRTLALVHGFWVAEGQSVTDSGTLYQEWIPLLRALCLRVDVTDSEASLLKLLIPDVGELLARPVADPPTVKPEEMQGRLTAILRSLLGKIRRPLLVILEDLHWARTESLALLATICRDIATLPVMIVGTFRSDEQPDLPQRLPQMSPLLLRRLGHSQIAQLSVSMLGDVGQKPELVDYLERQTEGNVFFLVEIVRALADDVGGLRLIGQGTLPDMLLTTGIERIVERRLEHVKPIYRPALAFAATLGRKLDLRAMEQAFPDIAIRSLLLQCANAAVLESQGADFRFAHDKLRETILRKLDAQTQSTLHLQVAEALESVHQGEDRAELCAQLAFHFARGHKPERAYDYYVQAGDRAAKFGLLSEARLHYREALRALDQLPQDLQRKRERIDLIFKLMQSSFVSDPLEQQLQRAKLAQETLDSIGPAHTLERQDRLRQVRIDYYTGRAYYYVGQTGEAIRRYKRVLPLAQEFGDAELTATPAAVTGQALLTQGYSRQAYEMLSSAIVPLRQTGNELEAVRTQIFASLAEVFMGKYKAGLSRLDETCARAKAMNLPQLIFVAKLLQTIGHRVGMDWASMLVEIRPIAIAVDKMGERAYGAVARSLAAWAHAHLGQMNEAKAERDRALLLSRESGGRYMAADWFHASDAEIAYLDGRYKDAVSIAQTVIESSSQVGLPISWGTALRNLAAAQAQLGAPSADVDAAMTESLRVFALGDLEMDAAQTYLLWGEVCHRRGEPERGAELIEEARKRFVAGCCDAALLELEAKVRALGQDSAS